jgi:serine protease Do
MNPLPILAIAAVLVLSGCNRAMPPSAADGVQPLGNAPAPATDSGPPDDHSATFTPQTRRLISPEDVPLLEQINRENIKVASAALPSVVRITAMTQVDPHAQLMEDLPFRLPFGHGTPPPVRENVPSLGSGVIISKDGFIVTNYHVLANAQDVQVQLEDGRNFPARIVASDAPLDIAVLKVKATGLPALPWGNSDKVQVGEQVFAIGNPFALEDTVTRGIISAKGRNLPDSNYGDFLQTDAAINVGNSGGALVNIHGELIGINAAIASFTQGNEGVGFSIPSNLVRYAVEGLLRQGRIVRGYLGVRLPFKVDGGVVEQLGLESSRGALLAGVQRRSPADTAKLQSVDFITEVDGHKIDGVSGLRMIVAQLPVGKQVVVDYIRDGTPRTTTVKIAELPKDAEVEVPADHAMPEAGLDALAISSQPSASRLDSVLSGLQVTDLSDAARRKYGVDDIVTSGVVITAVQEGSPAEARGLLRGDVIEIACTQRGSIHPVANAGDFTTMTKGLKPDQSVVLLVHHGKSSGPEDRSSAFVLLGSQPDE